MRSRGEARELASCMPALRAMRERLGSAARIPCVLIWCETGRTVARQRREPQYGVFLSLGIAYRRVGTESGRWPQIRMALTAAKTMQERFSPLTCCNARVADIDVKMRLADNDAYSRIAALNDLVMTGPTLTNVNDFQSHLVQKGIDIAPITDAKIIATLGPSSSSPAMIRSLFDAGVDMFRLISAMETRGSQKRLRRSEMSNAMSSSIGIMIDLQGPKLRIRTFSNGPIELHSGTGQARFGDRAWRRKRVPLPHPRFSQP